MTPELQSKIAELRQKWTVARARDYKGDFLTANAQVALDFANSMFKHLPALLEALEQQAQAMRELLARAEKAEVLYDNENSKVAGLITRWHEEIARMDWILSREGKHWLTSEYIQCHSINRNNIDAAIFASREGK